MLVSGLALFALNFSPAGTAQAIYHDVGMGLICLIAFGILVVGIRSLCSKSNEGVVRTLPTGASSTPS